MLYLSFKSFSCLYKMPRPGTKQWLIVDVACLTSSPPPVPDNGSILVLSTNNQPRPFRQAHIPGRHTSQTSIYPRQGARHKIQTSNKRNLVFLGSAFNLGSDYSFIRGGQLKNWLLFSKNFLNTHHKVSDLFTLAGHVCSNTPHS